MKSGMLWFDDSPKRSLSDKVAQAVAHYRSKYGGAPNTCYVHAGSLAGGEAVRSDLRIIGAADVLPHHFWLGRAEPIEAAMA
ncbi:MAG: hypothetical protein FJZ90_09445, partial [Chloroflexi bacterium]|nr:hypothetical protein [Chloroflexota bacterium]